MEEIDIPQTDLIPDYRIQPVVREWRRHRTQAYNEPPQEEQIDPAVVSAVGWFYARRILEESP